MEDTIFRKIDESKYHYFSRISGELTKYPSFRLGGVQIPPFFPLVKVKGEDYQAHRMVCLTLTNTCPTWERDIQEIRRRFSDIVLEVSSDILTLLPLGYKEKKNGTESEENDSESFHETLQRRKANAIQQPQFESLIPKSEDELRKVKYFQNSRLIKKEKRLPTESFVEYTKRVTPLIRKYPSVFLVGLGIPQSMMHLTRKFYVMAEVSKEEPSWWFDYSEISFRFPEVIVDAVETRGLFQVSPLYF